MSSIQYHSRIQRRTEDTQQFAENEADSELRFVLCVSLVIHAKKKDISVIGTRESEIVPSDAERVLSVIDGHVFIIKTIC